MEKDTHQVPEGDAFLPKGRKPEIIPILAAQKIIADISSGLYRSPAAALKELVANAYDADATEVRISTDAPVFQKLVIHDNGSGMSSDDFKHVIQHIGGSRKRMQGDVTEKDRKIIGRIGIGMLAVAQLGFRFFVSSSQKGESTRFLAEVDLYPFHKDDAALASMGRIAEDNDEVEIGGVRYVEGIPEDSDAHYTVITVPDAKQGIISELTGTVRRVIGAHESLKIQERRIETIDELLEVTSSARRVDAELDGYYYLLWELGLLSPVNYSSQGPFREYIRHIDNANQFDPPKIADFKVIVDGIEIRRPQLFPNPVSIGYSSPDPKLYMLAFDQEVAGRRLKFSGYIYSQQPHIDPEELRGVHIRIRNVGIGTYDRTWLGYPFDEGIKFGQVTGEVYVDEGLESALNIDRDSFRETDVHYQTLRAYLWDQLRSVVFPEFKQRQRQYSKQKHEQLQDQTRNSFNEALLQLTAPLTGVPRYVDQVNPTLSTWIEARGSELRIHRARWNEFTNTFGLTRRDSQERFIRVLTALISQELLLDLNPDELEPLLESIALAVR